MSGDTGCGKSTQVPQIILDEALARKAGSEVSIVVTQPRRIAAKALAKRVNEERGEVWHKQEVAWNAHVANHSVG